MQQARITSSIATRGTDTNINDELWGAYAGETLPNPATSLGQQAVQPPTMPPLMAISVSQVGAEGHHDSGD